MLQTSPAASDPGDPPALPLNQKSVPDSVRVGLEPDFSTPGNTFAFPYEPYPIQTQFMKHLYDTLQSAGTGVGAASLAVMESPTGTGKSLSIICSALKWIEDQKAARRCQAGTGRSDSCSGGGNLDELPAWVLDFDPKRAQRQALARNASERQTKWGRRAALKLQSHRPPPRASSDDADEFAEFCIGQGSTSQESEPDGPAVLSKWGPNAQKAHRVEFVKNARL
eukprot:SAG31_NODE_3878_length_3791_cov_2.674702_2_plen_224_part_00